MNLDGAQLRWVDVDLCRLLIVFGHPHQFFAKFMPPAGLAERRLDAGVVGGGFSFAGLGCLQVGCCARRQWRIFALLCQ